MALYPPETYQAFLNAVTQKQWQRFGLSRRAGVCVPLFSIYSRQSAGIGEIPDLQLLADWCIEAGMSIIQLLPLNDTGFNFTPYDAQSTFALDPVYLSLSKIKEVPAEFEADIAELKRRYPAGKDRVNYEVKKAKIELLWKMFDRSKAGASAALKRFIEKNSAWLPDYALFKVLKEGFQEAAWTDWPDGIRNRDAGTLDALRQEHKNRILFFEWLQWQLFEQFASVKQYANERRVYLMGDLPFLVSRDSADVWAQQSFFKLNAVAGAPPDAFFSMGQRWGMPPYNWPEIEKQGYGYLIERVRYAECFYDMFRIDHVVGSFRLWTIAENEPVETHGLNGRFDPEEEHRWEEHGRKILNVMIQNAAMLPCAEDLGVVPEASNRTLLDFAIPGMDVQRWTKDWEGTCEFKSPDRYRENSIAVISNHDMTSFAGWWQFEAGTVDESLFKRRCDEKQLSIDAIKPILFDLSKSHHGRLRWKQEIHHRARIAELLGRQPDQIWEILEMYRTTFHEKEKFWSYTGMTGPMREEPSPALLEAALRKAGQAKSIFSIQLLQDLLDLEPEFPHDVWEFRINFPGTSGPHNWSLVLPLSLEQLIDKKPLNQRINQIQKSGDRI